MPVGLNLPNAVEALAMTPNDVVRCVRAIAGWETAVLLLALFGFAVHSVRLHQEDNSTGGKWARHVAPSRSRFLLAFCAAIFWWVAFYALMAASSQVYDPKHPPTDLLDKRFPHANVLLNFCQNTTTFCLVAMYAALAASGPKRPQPTSGSIHRSMLYKGWLLVLVVVTGLEVLTAYQQHVVPSTLEARHAPFNLFSGVAQGLALFLVLGRLEEHVIWDHLRPSRLRAKGFTPGKRRALLVYGYAYAALQATYPVLDQSKYYLFQPLIIAGAFLLKLLFFWLVIAVIRRTNGRPSALEHYLYETERFGAEDLQSYERSFMRRHVDPNFRRGSSESGYMGIDHSRISPYRRQYFGFPADRDGLLVTDVYAGSPAMKAGIRPGDYITHIRERPIGPRTTLKSALEGTRAQENVRVTYYRSALNAGSVCQNMCTVELVPYAQLPHQRTVRLSQPFLGLKIGHNHLDQGAVVDMLGPDGPTFCLRGIKRCRFDQTLVVADTHGLKQLKALMLPGEPLELDCEESSLCVRYGPLARSTTVQWKHDLPGRIDLIPAKHEGPTTVLGTDHHSILLQYADRFADGEETEYRSVGNARRECPIGSGHDNEGVLYVFDERLELVFEYYYMNGELERLLEWPVWRKVTAGKLFIFVGSKPEPCKKNPDTEVWRSRRGKFIDVQLARSEPRITDTRCSATSGTGETAQ